MSTSINISIDRLFDTLIVVNSSDSDISTVKEKIETALREAVENVKRSTAETAE